MHFLPVLLCTLLLAAPSASAAAERDVPVVAAASDLKFALEAAAAQFRADTGRETKLVFGSSGNLYRQIAEGAPFQLFMSADEDFVGKLADSGKTVDRGVLYATGRIALYSRTGSRLEVDEALDGFRKAVAAGAIRRFAIANPEHAPYGRAAEQALKKLGLWEPLRGKLVLAENVSQAAQFAASGSADGGIIALSLARAPELAKLGQSALIPENLHDPLRQRMVLVKGAGDSARALYRYLQEPAARALFKRNGFTPPGE